MLGLSWVMNFNDLFESPPVTASCAPNEAKDPVDSSLWGLFFTYNKHNKLGIAMKATASQAKNNH